MTTINIAATLNEMAIALSIPRCLAGKISPINTNGNEPNPIEKPTMNTIRLISGTYLEEHVNYRLDLIGKFLVPIAAHPKS